MTAIIRGTTPTIKYTFSVVDPADFSEAILTIKDSRKQEKLRKTLDTATVGTDYVEWTLTQEETLSLGVGNAEVQVRAIKDGTAIATDIKNIDVGRIIKDGVIDE